MDPSLAQIQAPLKQLGDGLGVLGGGQSRDVLLVEALDDFGKDAQEAVEGKTKRMQ